MERIASEYTQKSAQDSPERAIALDSSYGVFRARWIETARLREIRRYGCLVKPNARDEHTFQNSHGHYFFVKRHSNSRHTSRYFREEASFFAIITISFESGSMSLFNLKNSLKRRLILFRFVALPILLLTATPILLSPHGLWLSMTVKLFE